MCCELGICSLATRACKWSVLDTGYLAYGTDCDPRIVDWDTLTLSQDGIRKVFELKIKLIELA